MVLVLVASLLLGGGFVASQMASLNGDSFAHAQRMDSAPIRSLALLLLLGAIALSFVRDQEEPNE
jgi:hypothetical protein